jgi:hypothetical protein
MADLTGCARSRQSHRQRHLFTRRGAIPGWNRRLCRISHGARLLRTYTFDYTSDGFERAQGFIVLAGLKLEAVGLAGAPS